MKVIGAVRRRLDGVSCGPNGVEIDQCLSISEPWREYCLCQLRVALRSRHVVRIAFDAL